MNRNSIRWRLPVSYAVIALVAALSLGSVMLLVLRDYYADREREYLFGNATALQPVIASLLESGLSEAVIQDQIRGLSFLSQTQIRVLDPKGNAFADSGVPGPNQIVAVSAGVPVVGTTFTAPVDLPSGETRLMIYSGAAPVGPQVMPFEQQFIPGQSSDIILSVNASPYGYGFTARTETDSNLRRRSSEVVEVPIVDLRGRRLGTLEFSNGPSYGADIVDSVTTAWLMASVFAIALAALTGWFMSQRVTRPVLALQQATQQMERGNLAVRVDLPDEKQQEFLALANSFNGMAAQVEQTISTLRAFVADAAHELHTPLTALQANLELARDEGNASGRTRYLSRAQEQGQRLEALVTSLLDLSRIEAAEARVDFAPVDVIQLAQTVGEPFASRAEQADRTFSLQLPAEGLSVNGNESQLRQVLNNLLENALKFTPAGGTVLLRVDQRADELNLTVSDTGIGVPADDLPQLFERFHRGRNVAEYAGNGLGLAIVKAIVEAHGGRVRAESELGQGSAFVVTLRTDSHGE